MISSPMQLAIGQKGMTSSCTWGGSSWILGNIYSPNQVPEWAAQWVGWVTIPRSVREMLRCSSKRHGLGGKILVVVVQLDYASLEVFFRLDDSMILLRHLMERPLWLECWNGKLLAFRRDSQDRWQGDVLLYVRERLDCTALADRDVAIERP